MGDDAPEPARIAAEGAYAYLDDSARYVWVSESYSRWFGRSRQDMIGRHPTELLDAATWTIVRPHVERALAGEEVAFDSKLVVNGATRDVRVAYVPRTAGGEQVRGVAVLVTDLSAMKAVETALRRSERMLEHSQAAARVGSWEVTLDEGMWEVPGSALWSSETYRIFGYERGTPIGLALFYQRVHADDRATLQSRLALALGHGKPFEADYRVVHDDGSVRLVHTWLQLEREPGGKTTRVFGTCQDVSEQVRAETEIHRAREQLQLVVDSTPAFIARYDRERRLVWANKSYAGSFGKTPDELVGCRLVDLVGNAAFDVIEPFCARVLAGESVQVELEIPYVRGARFVHMAGAPTVDAAGNVDGCVAVLTDVTDGRRLEEERERALRELREADRRKDEFLAMLSHELRNPLGPILNGVEILGELEDREAAAEFREMIARQARYMKRLLDDLLDASRVSQNKIQLRKERVDVNVLLRQAVEVSRTLLLEKRHQLSLALTEQPLLLDADPTRLLQVFDNLINNAVKYTDAGGHIAIASAVDDGEVVIAVRDDGVGMTPDLLACAFDLFVQGTRSLDRAQGGLGIGLTLVRRLVAMHGGSVDAFSAGAGRGSELIVRLPLRLAIGSPVHGAPPALRHAASGSLRVLVVDDNVDMAKGLGYLLQNDGHQVAVAHDGPSAIAAAGATPPDLVLLDIELPHMDGYAVAARLRTGGHAHAAFVAVTGYGREEDLRRSREAGFHGHLVKPVDFVELQKLIVDMDGRRT